MSPHTTRLCTCKPAIIFYPEVSLNATEVHVFWRDSCRDQRKLLHCAFALAKAKDTWSRAAGNALGQAGSLLLHVQLDTVGKSENSHDPHSSPGA